MGKKGSRARRHGRSQFSGLETEAFSDRSLSESETETRVFEEKSPPSMVRDSQSDVQSPKEERDASAGPGMSESNVFGSRSFAEVVAEVSGRRSRAQSEEAAPPSMEPVDVPKNLSSDAWPPSYFPLSYGSKSGRPAVIFRTEEIERGSMYLRHSVIIKFTFGRPPTKAVRDALQLGMKFKGSFTLGEIWDSRHFLLVLNNEEDTIRALSNPCRKVGKVFYRVFRYHPSCSPKKEPSVIPSWVKLPGIHPSLLHKDKIAAIVGCLGRFLEIDDDTRLRKSFKLARACIELDASVTHPSSVWVGMGEDAGYWQKVIVENKMEFCSNCCRHGHLQKICKKKNGMSHMKNGNWRWVRKDVLAENGEALVSGLSAEPVVAEFSSNVVPQDDESCEKVEETPPDKLYKLLAERRLQRLFGYGLAGCSKLFQPVRKLRKGPSPIAGLSLLGGGSGMAQFKSVQASSPVFGHGSPMALGYKMRSNAAASPLRLDDLLDKDAESPDVISSLEASAWSVRRKAPWLAS